MVPENSTTAAKSIEGVEQSNDPGCPTDVVAGPASSLSVTSQPIPEMVTPKKGEIQAGTTMATNATTSGGATATIEKRMSPELQKMVDNMTCG
uniref:Uncharacterized protein n=2 Tax=Caenorhabditis japonica TaxID=281687 RepID=A0A8R1IPL9_CAEJA